ncbi:hypothetical protein ACFLTR_01155 [Chloroflexota bacterium]
MPDTEDADSAAETFWPEGYKKVIREDVRQLSGLRLNDGKKLRHVYCQQYSEKYSDLTQFAGRIADMLAIGAENGADDAFDEIIDAFLTESPLPEVPRHARYFWPQPFSQRVKRRLQQVIVDEYRQDEVYKHAYKVGYGPNARDNANKGSYRTFDEFTDQVAQLVVTEATNGVDDMLEAIYRAFVTPCPLPPARRYPRRLKMW